MDYVNVPATDLSASRIGLGTWAIGGWMWDGTDEELSIRTICAALERGVTRRAVGRADELRTRMREQRSAQVPSARS
jgi:hypothetical protein